MADRGRDVAAHVGAFLRQVLRRESSPEYSFGERTIDEAGLADFDATWSR